MLLVMRLLGRMDQKLDAPFEVDWNPSEWLSIVLESVEYPVRRVLHDLLCQISFRACRVRLSQ